MSVAEAPKPKRPHTTAKQRRLAPAEKAAILAAVAAGSSKIQVAQQFGVHPNTVSNICEAVRKFAHPSNPLAETWKEALIGESVEAVKQGLRARQDVYRAADIGVKVLTGLGEFVTGNNVKVDAVSNVVIQWGRSDDAQQPTTDAQCIDVTPVE